MNTIEWSAKAVRQLRKIADKRKRQDIYAEAQQLADCPGDIKRLQGRDDYRLRIGDHRVIFVIDQSGTPIIVTITQTGISKNSEFAQMQGAEKISPRRIWVICKQEIFYATQHNQPLGCRILAT